MIGSRVCAGPHTVRQGYDEERRHDLVIVECAGDQVSEFDLGPRTSLDRTPDIRLAVDTAMRTHEVDILVDLLGESVGHIDGNDELLAKVNRVITLAAG